MRPAFFLAHVALTDELHTQATGVSAIMNDQTLTCRDCGQAFTFTHGEQEFFASRGFTNPPSRCPDCRAARKAERSGGYESGYSGGSYAPPRREQFPAVCGQCGKDTLVPFKPRGDRPVYCADCFAAQRGRSVAGSRGGRGRW
jgi:CxxC-x17-CxxC domain-containing protein